MPVSALRLVGAEHPDALSELVLLTRVPAAPAQYSEAEGLLGAAKRGDRVFLRVTDHPGAIPPTYPKNGALIENSRGAAPHS